MCVLNCLASQPGGSRDRICCIFGASSTVSFYGLAILLSQEQSRLERVQPPTFQSWACRSNASINDGRFYYLAGIVPQLIGKRPGDSVKGVFDVSNTWWEQNEDMARLDCTVDVKEVLTWDVPEVSILQLSARSTSFRPQISGLRAHPTQSEYPTSHAHLFLLSKTSTSLLGFISLV